jgi:hypothetical protein
MKKIADGYFRFGEIRYPSEGVSLDMTVDRIDDEDLDTSVKLHGEFTVCGIQRKEFSEKLGALIDEYRI